MGLEVDDMDGSAFAIRAVPAVAGAVDPAELLRELAAQDVPASEPLERVRKLAATIACKAAVKAGHPLTFERMRWIAEALFACEVPTTCPHGRVALLRISDRDLDHRFGRI
jgi:DNA mismatch repair protein MutL